MKYREICFAEKPKKCKICGAEEDIQVHHVDGHPHNNAIENLMPVCEDCHHSIHQNKEGYEYYYQRLVEAKDKFDFVAQELLSKWEEDESYRPLAEFSDVQRDLLNLLAKYPGSNGKELRLHLEDARGGEFPPSTHRRSLKGLISKGLVDKSGPKWERAHVLTDDGRELLDADLNWQRDR